MRVVGQLVAHESAAGHVTGRAIYTNDIAMRDRGALHAWPVISQHAHAWIKHLELAGALDVRGVVTVLSASDVPGLGDSGSKRRDEPLFPTEVMYYSQPVAWVLGASIESARLGAQRVTVEYEELSPIVTLADAVAAGSVLDGPFCTKRGDVEAALLAAPCRLQGELAIGGQEHFYLETHASYARLDDSDGVVVEVSTQHPAETQEVIARVLGIPKNRVVVECQRLGGGFGGKEVQANAWAAIAALGATKTGRPVSVRLPRALDMALTGKRHPFHGRFSVGFARDGKLHAVRLDLTADGGWSLDLSGPVLWGAMLHCDNAYFVPNLEVTGRVMKTHKTSQTAFRGFGAPQGMLFIEEIMDRVARTLDLPPETVRENNFYRTGDATHYGQQVKDASRISRIWNELKASSEVGSRKQQVKDFNAASRYVKRGIAATPVKLGISFTARFLNQAGAMVAMYRDGSVQVSHGGTEMGQGLHTKVRQIAAEALGLDFAAVRTVSTSTDRIPNTSPTAASSSTDLNGAAVADACRTLLERLRPVAARLLGCPVGDVQFGGGVARSEGHEVGMPAVAEAAYFDRVPLLAQGFYRTPAVNFDTASGQGQPFHYFAFGAAVSEVEVDGLTGMHRILRTDLLEDVGTSLSPLIDRGQIEGGFMQGAGWLTIEDLQWDDGGRLLSRGASTYKIPSWSELPEVFNVSLLERAHEPDVVFGSKAVGEPPLMLAISVREAIREAIAAFGRKGIVPIDSPATPERILQAIESRRRQDATSDK